MNELRSPLCLLRFIWRSIAARAWMSGHEYIEVQYETPDNIQIIQCKHCGHESTTWSWK